MGDPVRAIAICVDIFLKKRLLTIFEKTRNGG